MKITNQLLKSTLICGLTVISQPVFSQLPEQDCVNAIPVCQDVIVQSLSYAGSGSISNEINSSLTCLGNGEQNSVWYRYQANTSGTLNFTIIPHITQDDYDWAVFDITNAACPDIFNDSALTVTCNFSPVPGPTGPNGSSGSQFKPVIDVIAGDVLVIVVTRFSIANQSGHTIDFSTSTANYFCDLHVSANTGANVVIYPNPTDGPIHVELDKIYKLINVDVYTMDGKKVMEKQAYNTHVIYIEPFFTSGVYFLRINIDGENITKKVLIK